MSAAQTSHNSHRNEPTRGSPTFMQCKNENPMRNREWRAKLPFHLKNKLALVIFLCLHQQKQSLNNLALKKRHKCCERVSKFCQVQENAPSESPEFGRWASSLSHQTSFFNIVLLGHGEAIHCLQKIPIAYSSFCLILSISAVLSGFSLFSERNLGLRSFDGPPHLIKPPFQSVRSFLLPFAFYSMHYFVEYLRISSFYEILV